ncbi:MAG: SGNH/GDSL hydrolase family protein [Chitinispirillaceae bacterium]|nr:SGNH/GDSL hydrolase family protein [Chitinispirillaceae bacterium]
MSGINCGVVVLKSARWLSVAMILLCIAVPVELFSATVTDTAAYFANLRFRLSVDKKINVAYFGGSITQGGNASDRSKTSYRALTTIWLKNNCPQASIVEIDASWGGTGSDLGSFRCTRDVTSKNPDLVFVEFAVNDWKKSSADIQPYMDGIVRNILRNYPNCVIQFLYTVHNNTIAAYDQGTFPPAVLAQQAVADHYHIGSINIGKKMWEEIKAGHGTLETLTTDGTHPNDAGHKIYADEIARVLQRYFLTPAVPAAYAPVTLTDPLVSNTVDNGAIIMANQLSVPSWTVVATGETRFPNQINCNKPGTKFTYSFKGTAIGMQWVQNTDGGDVEWSIDASASVKKTGYYSKSLGSYPVLTSKLAPGNHTLTMTILSTRNSASSGYYIRMGALFVDQDLPAVSAINQKTRIPAFSELSLIPVRNGSYGQQNACLLNLPSGDFISVTKIGLSGRVYDCFFKGELGAGQHRINLPRELNHMYLLSVQSARHGKTVIKINSFE